MPTDYEAAPDNAYSNVATLTSSTGRNDSNSVWGQGFLNAVTGIGNTAANLVSSFRTQRAPAAALTTTPTNLVQPTNYKPWLIGGGIVAALVVLVLMFRK